MKSIFKHTKSNKTRCPICSNPQGCSTKDSGRTIIYNGWMVVNYKKWGCKHLQWIHGTNSQNYRYNFKFSENKDKL
mgnify:CR=1 FL=1